MQMYEKSIGVADVRLAQDKVLQVTTTSNPLYPPVTDMPRLKEFA